MPKSSEDKYDLRILHNLMQKYEKSFFRFAYSYIGDPEAAEDYVLESFMDYWDNRHTFTEKDNLPAYILTVVKHKCLNHLRHRKYQDSASSHIRNLHQWELDLQINSLESCDPKEMFTSEIYEIVKKTLAGLPSMTREIFYLSRFQNKCRKEISDTMNISVKGVEYHLSKALTALKVNLKDYIILLFLTFWF